jgi:hypothetical protein
VSGEGVGAGNLGGKASVSLSRVAPFTLMSSLFVVKPPGKPGERDLGMVGWVGVIGEGSNPDLIGV